MSVLDQRTYVRAFELKVIWAGLELTFLGTLQLRALTNCEFYFLRLLIYPQTNLKTFSLRTDPVIWLVQNVYMCERGSALPLVHISYQKRYDTIV